MVIPFANRATQPAARKASAPRGCAKFARLRCSCGITFAMLILAFTETSFSLANLPWENELWKIFFHSEFRAQQPYATAIRRGLLLASSANLAATRFMMDMFRGSLAKPVGQIHYAADFRK
jgi:hypothetical protein